MLLISAPGFWDFIEIEALNGNLYAPSAVYDEIKAFIAKDDLYYWLRDRKNGALVLRPTEDTQKELRKIVDHLQNNVRSTGSSKIPFRR